MKTPCPDHLVVLERRAPHRVVRAPSIAKVVPSHRRDAEAEELARMLRTELLVIRCADDWTALRLRPGAGDRQVKRAVFELREQLTTVALRDRELPYQARTDAHEIVLLLGAARARILDRRPRLFRRASRAGAMIRAARMALRDGDHEIARALLHAVVERRPDDPEACALLGLCIVRDPSSGERELTGARRLLRLARARNTQLVEQLFVAPPWSARAS